MKHISDQAINNPLSKEDLRKQRGLATKDEYLRTLAHEARHKAIAELGLKNYIERKSLKVYLMNFDKLLINQDSEIKKILEFCELETSNDQFKNQVIFKKTSEYNRNSISTENKEKVNLIFQKLLLAESDQ